MFFSTLTGLKNCVALIDVGCENYHLLHDRYGSLIMLLNNVGLCRLLRGLVLFVVDAI